MYGYYSFTVRSPKVNGVTLVVFCATARPDPEEVIAVVQKHCLANFAPDKIVLLGLSPDQEQIDAIVKSERLRLLLPQSTRLPGTPILSVRLLPKQGLPLDTIVGSPTWSEIRHAGLRNIFLTRKAVLVAPGTHHFAKPSKQHCSRFIRTANALVDGAEIFFMASCCLPYIPDSIKHIYLDTGGISVLAFAINSVRRRFDSASFAATVNTFESYGGIEEFDFRDIEDSIVLLSASTSSSLENRILLAQPRYDARQIITVFGAGTHISSTVIFDIRTDSECSDALGPKEAFSSHQCQLCDSGSIAIPMMGDQFIPVRSNSERVAFVRSSAPDWLRRSVGLYAGTQILSSSYRSRTTQHASKDLYFDLRQLINSNDSKIFARLDRAFVQAIPASANRIVHLDDDDSQQLANIWADRLRQIRRENQLIEVVSAKQLANSTPLQSGATAVIASVIASGNTLLGVSRSLRTLQPNGSVSYIVGIARLPSKASLDKLVSDLRMRELGMDYSLTIGETVYLPDSMPTQVSPWDEELELLKDIADTLPGPWQTEIERRITELNTASSDQVRGLRNNLFWRAQTGRDLSLSNGFVYFPDGHDATHTSQADVYFAIAAVLHHNRLSSSKAPLRQTEYTRKLLCPLMFDRFNDGVIQAAFLRGCVRPELDYSIDQSASRDMRGIIERIFLGFASNGGESLREFALALTLKKLVLADNDLPSVKELLLGSNDNIVVAFTRCLK